MSSFAGDVWNKLTALDVSDQVVIRKQKNKKTGNVMEFSYLPWAAAWSLLMSEYPESSFSFDDHEVHPDGTVSTWCCVEVIKGEDIVNRRMWLPVMDYSNEAIKHPDARAVSDTQMRCLVKTLSLFGLGNKLYKGDGLPYIPSDEVTQSDQLRIGLVAVDVIKAIELENNEMMDEIISKLPERDFEKLSSGTPPQGFLKSKQKEAIGTMRYNFRSYLADIRTMVTDVDGDSSEVLEALGEMSDYAKRCLWINLTDEEQHTIQELKENEDE